MSDLQSIRWDDLKTVRVLGKGSFATVYLGRWQGSDVAIKQLNVAHLPAGVNDEFVREAVIHAKCSASPRIARLYGITQEPGHFALVMEYMPKGSLYDVLDDKRIELPWPTRWDIAIDVGTGLAYLHGAKILHQDLKSLNILLDADLRAKITDLVNLKLKRTSPLFRRTKRRVKAPARCAGVRPKRSSGASNLMSLPMCTVTG